MYLEAYIPTFLFFFLIQLSSSITNLQLVQLSWPFHEQPGLPNNRIQAGWDSIKKLINLSCSILARTGEHVEISSQSSTFHISQTLNSILINSSIGMISSSHSKGNIVINPHAGIILNRKQLRNIDPKVTFTTAQDQPDQSQLQYLLHNILQIIIISINQKRKPRQMSNEQVVQLEDNNKQLQQVVVKQEEDEVEEIKSRKPLRENEQKAIKKKRNLLSFKQEIEEQESQINKIKKKNNIKVEGTHKQLHKNENIYKELQEEYYRQMERLKEELLELEYSYWDGPNVIKKIRRKKKEGIRQILQVCRLQLIENFQNVASIEARQLLFVIKDFIVPHEMYLAHIQILKLKTSKDDLLLNLRNVKIKKDGKDLTLSVNLDGPVRIIQKSRYEKNKSNYPFINWQTLVIR